METLDNSIESIRKDKRFFGHPRGMGVLALGNFCNSAAWGAFYAILIFYLYAPWMKGLGFSHGDAAMLVAAMGVGNSILGIVGSWLADRVLGMRKALIFGNLLKAAGMFMFAIPIGSQGLARMFAFIGLLFLSFPIMGASNYSLTGQLYDRDDNKRRDSAFTVYGIVNSIASLFIPALTAQIGLLNYHIGFAIGGVFALLYGLSIFITQHKFFGELGAKATRPLNDVEKKRFSIIGICAILLVLGVSILISVFKFVTFTEVMNTISGLAFIIPIVFLFNLFHKKTLKEQDKKHLKAFLWFYTGQVLYFLGTTLLSTSVLVFIDTKIEQHFFGITIAPGSIQTIYAILGLIIGPFILFLWNKTRLGNLNTVLKYSLGLFFYAVGFTCLTLPAFIFIINGRHSAMWIVAFYLFVTISDQLLGAIGFSAVSKLAPVGEETQMQTAWGLGGTIANGLALITFQQLQSVNEQLIIFPVMAVVFLCVFILFIVNIKRISQLMV
ncbi:oligopeptide:H+ symporter [Latilactobacillus fragifolii]|uniref:oligopeptide:H+ symporter n=1 Tax=Latilactobacillus fragifolii TaxID=2814244 RepID=UPI001ABA5EBA|nr:oligopeptide:H+ symporter [Latilactobacillus fragifolii]